jgi:hypothetical protein
MMLGLAIFETGEQSFVTPRGHERMVIEWLLIRESYYSCVKFQPAS